ncbi:hypothetical protein FRB99_008279 [Tulasnella sp. 403]|nr:hypothetical protein FRB99_008279 [Tulasnella sp. 403]
MYSDSLEQLVLSGNIFGGKGDESPPRPGSPAERSSPPSRPTSPSQPQTTYVNDSVHHRPATPPPNESIGLGPGRTGVKGVIRDRDEAVERELEKARAEKEATVQQQKKQDFSAKSYFQELDQGKENDQKREGDAWQGVEEWRERRLEELKATAAGAKALAYGTPGAVFGHLREVGVGGFVEAVDKVPKELGGRPSHALCGVGCIAILVAGVVAPRYIVPDGRSATVNYSLSRCVLLNSHLSILARRYPTVKFLRARATAIGFSTSGATNQISSSTRRQGPNRPSTTAKPYRNTDESDSDDANHSNFVGAHSRGDDDQEDRDSGVDSDWEAEPDYDVLPTMLVYRGGELVVSWPRVDWEVASAVGKGGGVSGGVGAIEAKDVESLLMK